MPDDADNRPKPQSPPHAPSSPPRRDAHATEIKPDLAASRPGDNVKDLRDETEKTKAKFSPLYETFRSMGLSDYSASLLTAHAFETLDDPEHVGRTEALAWAQNFQRLNPVPWFDLQNGNLNGFVASLKRANLKGLSAPEYAERSTTIRG